MLLLLLLLTEPLGVLPDTLRLEPDPPGMWVGRAGVGLSEQALWLNGEELPRWQVSSASGYDGPLVTELEQLTVQGRSAAGELRYRGELYLELAPSVTLSDAVVVLGSAQRAGFSQVRLTLQGAQPLAPITTQVGPKPGARQVSVLLDGQLTPAPECSVQGPAALQLIAIEPSSQAEEWVAVLGEQQASGQSALRLAALGPVVCPSPSTQR